MQISVKGKNRKISAAEEDLIRKKLARLPHYLEHLREAEVIISAEHPHRGADQQVVQLTVRANGTLLRAEEHAGDMPTALDAATAKLERLIERYKGRHERNKKGRTPLGEAVALEEPEVAPPVDEGFSARPIVRTKRFEMQPMPREDAVEQMELLGHNFFVFWDADTKRTAVLYRRQDGDYGLLEPEMA
ncbi:MAG: ribosome hibernation-promoting factor, HPF/YfiA family [Chloroflexia bacterium]